MPSKNKKSHSPVAPSADTNINILGYLACLFVFLIPFLPDEKIIRLKLEAYEIAILILLALAGARFLLRRDVKDLFKNVSGNFLTWAAFIWFAVQCALWFIASEKSLANQEMRRVFLAFGTFLAFQVLDLSESWKNRCLLVGAAAGALLSIYGILQRMGGLWPIQVPQMDRVMGTYGNPIFFAAYLLFALFVTWAAMATVKRDTTRFLLGICLLLEATAIYFTQTRATWIALVATFLVLMLLRSSSAIRPARWIAFLAFAAVFAYATRHVWSRDQGHLLIWRDTLRMWKDAPITGVGLGAFHTNFIRYAGADLTSKWPQGQVIINYAHNEYLQTLAEGGVIGLVSFLLLLGAFLKSCFGPLNPQDRILKLGGVALLIQNFFSVDMRFNISFANFFLLMSLSSPLSAAPAIPFSSEEKSKRWPFAVGWILLLGGVIMPAALKPYQAQKAVSATPGFFDEKLLEPAKSVEALEKLALDYPTEPAVLEKLAYVYAKQMKTADGKIDAAMTEKAVGTYRRIVELDPTRVSAINNLANILYTAGRIPEAIQNWEKAVQVNPDFLDAHLNLGKVLYVQGRLKESAAHFEHVLKIDPTNNEAIVYLKRMVE